MLQFRIDPQLDGPIMSLRSILCTTQLIFFAFGHAPLPFAIQKRYSYPIRKCLQSVPSLVCLYIIYLSGLQCFQYDYMYTLSASWTDVIVGSLYSVCGIGMIVCAIVSPWVFYNKFTKINELLIQMESEFQQRLIISFDGKAFNRKYLSRIA